MRRNEKPAGKSSAKAGTIKEHFGGGKGTARALRTTVFKSQGLNLELLDKISEEYMLSPNSFQDINKVELALLSEQYSQATNKNAKISIKEVIDKYELQQKKLLKKEALEQVEEKRNNPSQESTTSSKTSPQVYEMNDNDELVPVLKEPKSGPNESITSNIVAEENETKTELGFSTPRRKITNSRSAVVSDKKKTPNNEVETTKRKLNGSNESRNESKVTKINTWNNSESEDFKSAATVLFKDKDNENKNNQANFQSSKESKQNYIRLRIQFKAKTRENNTALKHEVIVSNILYNLMQGAKAIDKNASLMPWADSSEQKEIQGNELRLHTGEKINEYLDIPDLKENLVEGKMYYQNGVRIKTDLTAYEFTEKWSNKRYEKDEKYPNIEWIPLKPAEMQKSEKAYPIGYLVGTTERGDYNTLNEKIGLFTKTHTEVSFQFVNQAGVTPSIWQFARLQAEKANENPRSKLHKKTKFKYAPSALIVYVSDKTAIKSARRILIERFGKLENGLWPVMPDGSRMRFVPIIFGNIHSNSTNEKKQLVFNHLYDQLILQASSKAGEIYLDLDMWDLHTRHEYLNGSTLEEVIHGLTSTTKTGIPIFKHITRKWSRNPEDTNYEVAVAPSMLSEAQETLRTIRPALKRKFGILVNNHFRPPNGRRTPTFNMRRDEFDPDVEDFLIESTTSDKYSQVLIEGMDFLCRKNTKAIEPPKSPKQNAMMINEGHKEESVTGEQMVLKQTTHSFEVMEVKSDEGTVKTINNGKEGDLMSVFSNLTKDSKTGTRATWEEITIANEHENCKPATEAEITTIQEKIARYNITMEEIEMWKNLNNDEYSKLTNAEKAQDFKTLLHVIKGVIQMRKDMQESNKEIDNYATFLHNESLNNISTSNAVTQGQSIPKNEKAHQPDCNTSTSTSKKEESKTGTDVGRGR